MHSTARDIPATGTSSAPQTSTAPAPTATATAHTVTTTPPSTAAPTTGQWLVSDGIRWRFDTGSLALDFAYTGRVSLDPSAENPDEETLRSACDLTAWLENRLPSAPATDRDLQDALMLRGSIVRLALAASASRDGEPHDIDLLNLYAATPDIPPRLAGGTVQAGRTAPRTGQALSTLARDAVALLSGVTVGRIRACDADDCDLIYLDTSRAGNRRWCSMQRCGNRHKVRAHRAREAATR